MRAGGEAGDIHGIADVQGPGFIPHAGQGDVGGGRGEGHAVDIDADGDGGVGRIGVHGPAADGVGGGRGDGALGEMIVGPDAHDLAAGLVIGEDFHDFDSRTVRWTFNGLP